MRGGCVHQLFCKKKRKKRSTHICMHNCATQRTQYSRRLLSILAQPVVNTKQKKKEECCKYSLRCLLMRSHRLMKNDEEKKCGAHTHVRTTVQLSERNIHVGCCLFSHNINIKIIKKRKSEILMHFCANR